MVLGMSHVLTRGMWRMRNEKRALGVGSMIVEEWSEGAVANQDFGVSASPCRQLQTRIAVTYFPLIFSIVCIEQVHE